VCSTELTVLETPQPYPLPAMPIIGRIFQFITASRTARPVSVSGDWRISTASVAPFSSKRTAATTTPVTLFVSEVRGYSGAGDVMAISRSCLSPVLNRLLDATVC
jgi:hypothetical protein